MNVPVATAGSVVYFVESRGRVKIGYTRDIHLRLSALRASIPDDVRLLRTIEGGRAVETWFHKEFAAAKLKGEWFCFDQRMLSAFPPAGLSEAPRYRRKLPKPTKEGLLDAVEFLGIEGRLRNFLLAAVEPRQ